MRIEKKAARTIQNHGKAWQTERLGTQQDRQSLPHSSCCWRKGPSLTHTPSSQGKSVFCWISYPSAPSSRSAEGRRSLQGISATHRFNSLLENAQWGWEMKSREILDWIQGHVLNRELCNHEVLPWTAADCITWVLKPWSKVRDWLTMKLESWCRDQVRFWSFPHCAHQFWAFV